MPRKLTASPVDLFSSLAWLPIPLLLVAMVVMWAADLHGSHDSPFLVMVLNLVFSTMVSLFIACLVARSFLVRPTPGLLLLGCGVILWGAAGFVGNAAGRGDFNVSVTVHNTCVWLSALCHLAGAILSLRRKPAMRAAGPWLAAGYVLALGVVWMVTELALGHWTPLFFVQGQGGTPLRQVVLISAILMFVLTAVLLWMRARSRLSPFLYWYCLAVLLFAAGLFGVMVQSSRGSLLNWTGRGTQLLSGVYMLIAAIASVRESRAWSISLGEALHESEERLRLVLEATSIGTFEIELTTGEARWNAVEFKLLGLHPGDAPAGPETFFRFVHPEDVEGLRTQWHEAMQTGTLDAEFRIMRADGQERWLAGKGHFVFDVQTAGDALGANKRAMRFLGVNFDITERKRAEEAMAAAHRQVQSIIDNTTAIVYAFDLQERFLLANTALAELFKTTPKQMIGKRRHELMPKEDADWHEANDRQVIEAGRAIEFEEYNQLKGRSITWLTTKFPLRDAQGRIYAVAGISADVSDRKQLEQERNRLLQAEQAARSEAEKTLRLKDEFLATVSHELRNPLNALMGWTQLLAKGSVPVPKAVDIIGKSASALSQIVSDLLDMSRIVSGKTQLMPEPTDLAGVVGNVLDGVRLAADAKSINVQASLDPELQSITCDPGRVQQIIHNLLSNAVKFTPENGRIAISVKQSHECVDIAVADNGQGIAPDFLPHVFDQFRQADQSKSRYHGGLGLGLAIVKHLVELHGGTVRAQSEGLDRGATFTISLPRHHVSVEAEPAVSPSRRPVPNAMVDGDLTILRGRRVLVVDDDANNCEFVARVLEESGATARTATSGHGGLKLIAEFQPDLVISDIGMPGMNGYEFVRRLRLNGGPCASLLCLALTAYARPEDREEALRAGFDEHLSKPFNSAQLAQALARLREESSEPPA